MASSAEATQERDDIEARQLRTTGAQVAQQEDTSFERDVLEYLGKSDLDEKLDDNKYRHLKEVLSGLLSRDFVLAYVSDAEHNEGKWDLRILKNIVELYFPSDDCLVTGDLRAAINDDPDDTVEPLTKDERLQIEVFFRVVEKRLTRSKNMKQQEMLRTSIAQTEVRRDSESNGGRGLLGRLRR